MSRDGKNTIVKRTPEDMRAVLAAAVKAAGSQRKWAAHTGCDQGDVSKVLAGRMQMPGPMANALGYVAQTVYFRA